MRLLAAILFLSALATPTGAVITWQQPARWSCLYRNGTILIECRDRPAGLQTVALAPTNSRDAAYVPHPGDSYQVVMGSEVVSTRLVYRVWLTTVRR
jgi:hypothetical protein